MWDRLSRLNFEQACKLLGPRAKKLIMQGAGAWDIDIDSQVKLTDSRFRVDFGSVDDGRASYVTVNLRDDVKQRLGWSCSVCSEPCLHVGAAFALLLEEKVALGLAAPPSSDAPIESLNERQLIERALDDRRERARTERMQVQAGDNDQPWTDYVVTSTLSGKTYRVALRGFESGQAFCSCPDFRTNTLGTCKHVMKVTQSVHRRFDAAQLKRAFRPKGIAVFVNYAEELSLRYAGRSTARGGDELDSLVASFEAMTSALLSHSERLARAHRSELQNSLELQRQYAQMRLLRGLATAANESESVDSTLERALQEIAGYLDKYVRGANGVDARERVKVMKLVWDAIGTEFGGRQELYELNYSGNHEDLRLQTLFGQMHTGQTDGYRDFVDRCLSEYDLHGWTVPDLVNPDDVSIHRAR